MVGLARYVLRHKTLVALFWVGMMIAGGATSSTTIDRLTVDFSLPGQQGFETEKQLLETYGTGPNEGTSIIAVTVPAGTTVAAEQDAVDGVFDAVQRDFPQYRVVWQGNTGAQDFVTGDGQTAYGVVDDTKFSASPSRRRSGRPRTCSPHRSRSPASTSARPATSS